MRVAVLGLGAIGTLVTRTLAGRVPLLCVDRTKAPLNGSIDPVDIAVVTTKSQGTAWAAETAKRVLGKGGTVLTIQNGLGHRERLATVLGDDRVAGGVIHVGAALGGTGLRTTGPRRPREIDWISGEVVRRGRRHSVPTPVNEALLKLVEVLEAYP